MGLTKKETRARGHLLGFQTNIVPEKEDGGQSVLWRNRKMGGVAMGKKKRTKDRVGSTERNSLANFVENARLGFWDEGAAII